ncbi:hypothetical protein [Paractinoplanes maris]|uniref:hypothetical protein n=1 Tax=Paractinoplanes maris TaxID=1734446 RepID=UPI002020F615|nr:hypothetical protein [Actinoplanes maris]
MDDVGSANVRSCRRLPGSPNRDLARAVGATSSSTWPGPASTGGGPGGMAYLRTVRSLNGSRPGQAGAGGET